MTPNAYVRSVGSYLPKKIMTNSELEKILDTNDEWITKRTGIKQRHLVTEEFTSDLAHLAALDALDKSDIQASDIDLIIVATTTSDKTFPSTAAYVQSKLNITKAVAFDIQAVCSGFIYALSIANNFIKNKQAKNILVIGAESMSKIVDWSDRSTAILFGDGAGAFIVSATTESSRGIIDVKLESDGAFSDMLYTNGGVSFNQTAGVIKMNGGELLKKAVDKMSEITNTILKDNNYTKEDIDYLIPHQANIRILLGVAKKLNLDESKLVATIDKHANTSAASIPLAVASNICKFKTGDLLALTAFGGGLTWGAALIRW